MTAIGADGVWYISAMLKRLALLALLSAWLVHPARPQVPRDGGQKHDPSQDKSDTANPAPSLAPVQTQHPTNQESAGKDKSSGYPWRELLAPANIPNWTLCVVGAVAGWLAWSTLKAIKQQVDMFISKERARLSVEMESFYLGEPNALWEVEFRVTNHGATNAVIENALCLPCIQVAKWDTKDALIRLQIQIPKIMAPNPDGVKVTGPIQLASDLNWDIGAEDIEALTSRRASIYVVGYIEFRDVFDTRWRLDFCRKWNKFSHIKGEDDLGGTWTDCGENKERQIKEPHSLAQILLRIRKAIRRQTRPPHSTTPEHGA